jgi:hypothetical protein
MTGRGGTSRWYISFLICWNRGRMGAASKDDTEKGNAAAWIEERQQKKEG